MAELWDLASEALYKIWCFIFMFRVIDFKSREGDDDSDGALFQNDGKKLSTCRMTLE